MSTVLKYSFDTDPDTAGSRIAPALRFSAEIQPGPAKRKPSNRELYGDVETGRAEPLATKIVRPRKFQDFFGAVPMLVFFNALNDIGSSGGVCGLYRSLLFIFTILLPVTSAVQFSTVLNSHGDGSAAPAISGFSFGISMLLFNRGFSIICDRCRSPKKLAALAKMEDHAVEAILDKATKMDGHTSFLGAPSYYFTLFQIVPWIVIGFLAPVVLPLHAQRAGADVLVIANAALFGLGLHGILLNIGTAAVFYMRWIIALNYETEHYRLRILSLADKADHRDLIAELNSERASLETNMQLLNHTISNAMTLAIFGYSTWVFFFASLTVAFQEEKLILPIAIVGSAHSACLIIFFLFIGSGLGETYQTCCCSLKTNTKLLEAIAESLNARHGTGVRTLTATEVMETLTQMNIALNFASTIPLDYKIVIRFFASLLIGAAFVFGPAVVSSL